MHQDLPRGRRKFFGSCSRFEASLAILVATTACRNEPNFYGHDPVKPEAAIDALLPLTEMGPNTDSLTIVVGKQLYQLGHPAKSDLEYFLARIFHGMVFENGSSVVVDRKAKQILLVDSTGKASIFAPQGEGPGEIREASGIMRNLAGKFAVLDNGNQRMTRYSLETGEAVRVNEFATAGYPNAECALDSGYVTMGFDPKVQSVFAVYPLSAKPLRRFGPPLIAGSELLNDRMSHGHLLCMRSQGRFIAAVYKGELISYSPDGEFLWRKAIPDYQQTGFVEGYLTLMVEMIAKGATSSRVLTGMVALNDSVGIVQLQEYTRATADESEPELWGRVLTKFFDLSTGRLLGEQDNLPLVLSAHGEYLLLVEGDRFEPWLRVVQYQMKGKVQ